jgi:hypothetical protein
MIVMMGNEMNIDMSVCAISPEAGVGKAAAVTCCWTAVFNRPNDGYKRLGKWRESGKSRGMYVTFFVIFPIREAPSDCWWGMCELDSGDVCRYHVCTSF